MRARLNIRALTLIGLLASLLALLAVAGCGGSSSADSSSDPQELLNETFNGDSSVDSGVLTVSFDASAQGGAQQGSVVGTVKGPFQSNGADKLPSLDLTAGLQLDSGGKQQSIDGSLTLTSDGLYLTTNGQPYQLDDATFQQLEASFAQSAQAQSSSSSQSSAIFDQLGIDPSTWLTDVKNEGTEDVGGTQTVHISGTPDIAQIFSDAQKLDPTGQAGSIGNADQIAKTVKSASIDVYTGADDKILRQLTVQIELQDPSTSQTVNLKLQIVLSDVNQDQTIEAPANPKPLEQLIPGGLGAALGGSGVGLGSTGSGSSSGSGAGSSGISAAQYQKCLQQAGTPDELAKCLGQQ